VVLFLQRAKDLLQSFHTGSEAHRASYLTGTSGFLPGINWPGREAVHTLPSIDEVKCD
jgi:hypothetical protein